MSKKNKSRQAAKLTKATPAPEISKPKTQKRSFNAAMFSRLTESWGMSVSINSDLQQGLKTLRDRCRDLSINNELARRYLKLIKTNIVGPDGVQLSVQAQNIDGSIDKYNNVIESHFDTWGRPENCEVTGRFDWRKVQELVLESTARDGEALVWLRRGLEYGKYSFQLELLDADHLDENYTTIAENGNKIFQGVELNNYGRAVAYHIWDSNPADRGVIGSTQSNFRIRVDANDLLHIFDPDRASQVRGYPWMAASMLALYQVGEYRQAELIAARMAACKQLYYKQNSRDAAFSTDEDELDDVGNATFNLTPGSAEILPLDFDIETVDFSNPNSNFAEFQKSVIRVAASGLNVSYNSLANDLESVNYSSARFGGLEDQAQYRSTQRWFINALVKPVYEEWLKMQLLTNTWGLKISQDKFDKFNTVRYIPRTWQSVDPVKDLNADVGMLNASLTSHSDVISKSGRDPEEVFMQIAKDKARMAELGITPIEVQTQLAILAAQLKASDAERKNQTD